MATWPRGKAKVCNTYITSSNLVVALRKLMNSLEFIGFFCYKIVEIGFLTG